MTLKEFLGWIIPKTRREPVLRSLTTAQICLESGFGRHSFFNNYIGIKCHHPGWYDGCRLGKTSEVIDGTMTHGLKLAFQCYYSIDENIEDYYRLMGIDRYERVRRAKNYIEATEAIRACGYATSLTYRDNLRKIIEKYVLWELDKEMITYNGITLNDFTWEEGYSSKWENGKRLFKVVLIPEEYMQNAFEVFRNLQIIRTYFNKPLIITPQGCLYRTIEYNKQVGGAARSQHIYANAADVKIAGVEPNKIYEFAKSNTAFKGFGIGRTFIHVDLRPKFTVWYY